MFLGLPCSKWFCDACSELGVSFSSDSFTLVSGLDMDEWLLLYLFDLDADEFIRSKWDLSVRYDDAEGDSGILFAGPSLGGEFDLAYGSLASDNSFASFPLCLAASVSKVLSLQRSLWSFKKYLFVIKTMEISNKLLFKTLRYYN